MQNPQQKYQPGLVFFDSFKAGLTFRGSSMQLFAEKHSVKYQNIRFYATGHSNGPRSVAMRNAMIEEVGPELFHTLYRARKSVEAVV
ncbi:hypothetical protein [Thalassococcus sp. S3]|uniref:hypothetical protein n=1 Tax=Thalassococcus sp. S3 TaxID=2017482 RepID=UPI0013EE5CC1|nr:hypothetical protein [Thalassococcus sp. S3]